MHVSENQQWGIPNWESVEGYPPTWLYPRLFAWEFLRRNPRYREAWLDRRSVLAKAGLEDWRPFQKLSVMLTSETPAALWELDPRALPDETLFAYEERIGYGSTYTQKWGGGLLTAQWGYSAPDLLDPRRSAFDVRIAAEQKTITIPGDLHLSFCGGTDVRLFDHRDPAPKREDGEFLIVFDAREPLEAQLASASRQLKKAQKLLNQRGIATTEQPPKDTPSPVHLRILDGLAAGASLSEIAAILHPDDAGDAVKKASDEKKKAMFWRDDGWRRLMRITENRARKNRR